ncbi:NAD(P)/FAD-dependent oxidoreductase [Pontibacillus salicampi]|uniref:NAD(P)/FAD-dependent oxidoreductase n=1 Tax=Pontibacillus salicampi TaxID=1449801 RepID=A0ABV6LN13_9BACI
MQSYIVIGAGVLGASTAYHLQKSGANVTIIDRMEPGQATEAAAGIICPWLSQRRNKKWYQLVKGGARYYPELIQQLESDGLKETGYHQVGAISLHTDDHKLDQMVERAKKRREDAPEIGEITKLSKEETKSYFPLLSDEYAGVHVTGGARVNGGALRKALIEGAVKHGATFMEGDASLAFEGTSITGAYVNGFKQKADKVIVTAGAWAKELLAPLGVHFQVSFQKAQITHLELNDADTAQWPVIIPPTNKYLLTFGGGKIVVGATHEDEAGLDYRVTAGGIYDILDKVLAIAPGLKDATYKETKVGFRPFTPGFLPVFGSLPGFENIYVANGLGSSGLTSGPYIGRELAKLALGEETELNPEQYHLQEAIE